MMAAKTMFVLFACLLACWTATAEDPQVTCTSDGQTLADPHNCAIYWTCDGLTPVYHACPPPQLFNAATLECGNRGTFTCPNGYPPVCTVAEAIIPDPYDCAEFWVCDAGLVPQYFICDAGLYYHVETDQCDWPANVPCVGGVRPPVTN